MKLKKFFKILSILTLLLSLFLIAYSTYQIIDAKHQVENTLKLWTSLDIRQINQPTQAPIVDQNNDSLSSTMESPSINYPSFIEGDLIGKLVFNTYDQELPIITGKSEKNLGKGILHFVETPLPGLNGNSVLLGHHDGVFRFLKDVKIGDQFFIETTSYQLTYEIKDLLVLEANDLSVFEADYVSGVTLVTCYPFHYFGPAPKRYVVRADLIEMTNR